MKNGLAPRSASRSEPTQSFQHHGQGHAAFFFFFSRTSDSTKLALQMLSLSDRFGPKIPEAEGYTAAREALILQDSEDPVQARAQTYYWLCWHRGDGSKLSLE